MFRRGAWVAMATAGARIRPGTRSAASSVKVQLTAAVVRTVSSATPRVASPALRATLTARSAATSAWPSRGRPTPRSTSSRRRRFRKIWSGAYPVRLSSRRKVRALLRWRISPIRPSAWPRRSCYSITIASGPTRRSSLRFSFIFFHFHSFNTFKTWSTGHRSIALEKLYKPPFGSVSIGRTVGPQINKNAGL